MKPKVKTEVDLTAWWWSYRAQGWQLWTSSAPNSLKRAAPVRKILRKKGSQHAIRTGWSLATDAPGCDMDATDRYTVFRAPSVMKVAILLQYCVTFLMNLALLFKLWHPHWLAYSEAPSIRHIFSRWNAAPLVETHSNLDDVDHSKATRIPGHNNELEYADRV